jgi:fumarate hydratase class I
MAGLLRSAVRRGFASGGVLGQSRAFNTRASVLLADTQFHYQDLYEPSAPKDVPWRKITGDHVSVVEAAGRTVLKVEPEAIRLLAQEAMTDIAHLLRPGHLAQLSKILKDPEASDNDRFVAVSLLLILPVCMGNQTDVVFCVQLELLKNANVAAGMVLPGCQDTGTAIVSGSRGQLVWTDGNDEEMISKGVYDTYVQRNLRYSQVAPLTMFDEKNTGSNLPAQIDLYAKDGDEYHFHFMAKGGGSANKTFLYQETKALLNPERMVQFLEEKIKTLGKCN